MTFDLTEEQHALVSSMREFSHHKLAPRSEHWDRTDEFPRENVELMAQAGLFGFTLSERYGGSGASALDCVLAMEQIAEVCRASAFLFACQNGPSVRALEMFASDSIKEELLPEICAGRKLIAWGMSEPGAGSDIGRMSTNAKKVAGGFSIRGEKTWISLAREADVFVVITRFENTPGLDGIGAILVPRDIPGLEVGPKIKTLGIHGTGMASLFFDGCEVPDENVILGPGNFRQLLEIMSGERVVSNPPISLGIAAAALQSVRDYLPARPVSGQPLSNFQGLRWKVADMAIQLESARLLVYRAAANAGSGLPSSLDASIAKVAANEAAVKIADTALQLHGAAGYSLQFPVERLVRDARGMCIGDGTVEIQRNLIANAVLGRRGAAGRTPSGHSS